MFIESFMFYKRKYKFIKNVGKIWVVFDIMFRIFMDVVIYYVM